MGYPKTLAFTFLDDAEISRFVHAVRRYLSLDAPVRVDALTVEVDVAHAGDEAVVEKIARGWPEKTVE